MIEKQKREASIKLVFRILGTVLVFDLIYLFSTIGEEFFLDENRPKVGNVITEGAIFDLFLIVLQVGVIFYLFIRWYFSYYQIEDNHITKKMGIFFQKDLVFNYSSIRIVQYRQGMLGTIFKALA